MIAEFMGLRYETRNYFGGDSQPDENGFDTYSRNSIMTGTYYDGKQTLMYVSQIEYHTSWDWLMPVIDKIYSIDIDVDFFNSINLESTYKKVVEFIKRNR